MIIGFTGQKGVGKDAAVAYMVGRVCSGSAVTVAFGDKLKEVAADLLLVEPQRKDAQDVWLLQHFATEVARQLWPDVWVYHALVRARHQAITARGYWYQAAPHIFFSDVRFANEAEAIHQLGGEVWSLWCSEETRRQRLGKQYNLSPAQIEELSRHSSEAGVTADRVFRSEIPEDFGWLHAAFLDLQRRATLEGAAPITAEAQVRLLGDAISALQVSRRGTGLGAEAG